MKRGGVKVSERKYDWHKAYHHRILGNPYYAALSFEEKGVYFHLKQLAAASQDEGAIELAGKPRIKRQAVQDYLVMMMGGQDAAERAKAVLQKLKAAGLVVYDQRGTFYIADYADEQVSLKPAAVRQREARARVKDEPGEGGEPAGGASPSGPGPSSPPPLTLTKPLRADAGSDIDRTGQGDDPGGVTEAVTCHRQESESESERGAYAPQRQKSESERMTAAATERRRPLTQTPTRTLIGGGEEGPGPEGLDIYTLPPIEAACRLTGNRGAWFVNTCRKSMRDLGPDLFIAAVAEVRDAIRDGVAKNPPALFNSILNRSREQLQRREGGGNSRSIGFTS